MIALENIHQCAKEQLFNKDYYEKTFRLGCLLQNFEKNEILQNNYICKGGASTCLFDSSFSRLFSDIDFDYHASVMNETEMLENRKLLRNILLEEVHKMGYEISPKSRFSYGTDSYLIKYINQSHNYDYLKIDLNYSLRNHIMHTEKKTIYNQNFDMSFTYHSLASLELLGTKIKALIQRGGSKDLYDVYVLLSKIKYIDRELLKKIVLFYDSISNMENHFVDNTWMNKIAAIDERNCRRALYPVIPKHHHFSLQETKEFVIPFLEELFVLTEEEKDFLISFEKGHYYPEHLFKQKEYVKRIEMHPMAKWYERHRK